MDERNDPLMYIYPTEESAAQASKDRIRGTSDFTDALDKAREQVEQGEVPRNPYCARTTYREMVQWIANSAPQPGERTPEERTVADVICCESRNRLHPAKHDWRSILCDPCIVTLCTLMDLLEAFHSAIVQLLQWFGRHRERKGGSAASETSKPEHIPE